MASREPPELYMPIPTSAASSSTAAALGRRLSKDRPTFTTQPNFFHPRPSMSKPPRTPSPRSNPESSNSLNGNDRPILTLHHPTPSATHVGPVAPDSPPFNILSPQQNDNTEVHDDDGIIRVENPRTRSLSNALNLPASPPTPAPSPIPREDAPLVLPSWQAAHVDEDDFIRSVRRHFMRLDTGERQRFLAEILNISETEELRFVSAFVRPRLKVDFLRMLPMEVGLRILSHVDDPVTLARASQVSRHWYMLVNDDLTWKRLCQKQGFRRLSVVNPLQSSAASASTPIVPTAAELSYFSSPTTIGAGVAPPPHVRRPVARSYKSHFRQRYILEKNWRVGGTLMARYITNDHGVVTTLCLSDKYIIVGLDNSNIRVFDEDGRFLLTLAGHETGVWAMVVVGEDQLVSGGCDRDMRLWDLTTGKCEQILRGHTSTVRCIQSAGYRAVVSGSRDTTLRVWDLDKGVSTKVLVGHSSSVRCLAVHGDLVVSGSYDYTAMIWSISRGVRLKTLTGHQSQIYAIAFDGINIATGSLDTSVRIWDGKTGMEKAVLMGHTSLVGQIQMRRNTLVTGGSDGSVRVWDLEKLRCVTRMAAHDNSVTSLQFDDKIIVTGGSDGYVKIWDLRTGAYIRDMTTPADSVWRVGFSEERAVVMSSRANHTSMEVYSFEPAEMVAEKTAARARARDQAAAQALRDLKKKPRPQPGMTMEVDEEAEEDESDDSKALWGGMDMVRESSEMSMGSVEDGEMWNLGTPIARGSSAAGSSSRGPAGR